MQKTELLHLHSLFRQLKQYLEREGDIDGAFERYEPLDVRPSHAHKPKERHREAVFALASDVTDELAVNSKYADDGASEAEDEYSNSDEKSSDAVAADG